MLPRPIESLLRCPKDLGQLRPDTSGSTCTTCGSTYPQVDGKLFFIPNSANHQSAQRGKHSGAWTTWRKANHGFFRSALEPIDTNAVMVDLGVGDAQFRDILHDKFPNLLALDMAPYPDANAVCDITRTLPIADGSCDVVFASNVFEHIPYPLPTLRECQRILKPGGIIVGTTPFLLDVHQAPYDFNRYTHFMLRKLLEDAEFHDVTVTDLGTPDDAMRTIQLHFFYKLYGHLKKNRNVASYYLAKAIWNCFKLGNLLIKKFLTLPATPEFAQGYGFTGRKTTT